MAQSPVPDLRLSASMHPQDQGMACTFAHFLSRIRDLFDCPESSLCLQ